MIATVTDPNGGTWGSNYDANKRLTSPTTPNKALGTLTTKLGYNASSSTETDPNNQTATFEYGDQGRQVKATDVLGHTKSQKWNVNSSLQSTTDGKTEVALGSRTL
ncbi:hypothetical protein [Amycolatopsis minnesotensis]|uniref:YD repeat-containing protein n=1 Tax=Amycolatopsis minnesotensis TaxID=337894 RepID=A0ABN2R8F5_9PSEU